MPRASTTSAHLPPDVWDDREAARRDPVGRLVYRSNLLGSDPRITNTGGGNTSSKATEADPLTGAPVEVLWVKGSGGDLRSATRESFASLELRRLASLREVYRRSPRRGPKSEAEDRMAGCYAHCTFNLNPRASSIDTPLHAFIPAAHVDHVHPEAVLAIAASRRGEALTREVYGDEVAWVPWQRPGFELGLALQELCAARPGLRGAVLGQHGLIDWDDDDRTCYALTLELIGKAARYIAAHDRGEGTFGGRRFEPLDPVRRREVLVEVLPWLRGRLSAGGRVIGTVRDGDPVLRFVDAADAPRLAGLGTACPDHFLRTKIRPLFVDWDPHAGSAADLRDRLTDGLERYRAEYALYYERCRRPGSPPMRDPAPTVVLVPGLGMVAWGRNKGESLMTAEFYAAAIEVMRGAEAIDEYVALPEQEAFDIEYWSLEEAKLRRLPPEKELSRRIVLVVGAGSGIGRAAARRVAAEGAPVVCADLDERAACETAAGLGAVGLSVDVTDRASVRELLARTVLAFGGLDHLAITAGLYVPPDAQGRIGDAQWRRTFDVNVTGAHIVADEARRIWEAQGLPGSLVLATSVNAVVAKKGSLAYDASKAAANHLVRELAVTFAPLVRVNAVAPATVVQGSSMFPRERVIASLEKYGIAWSDDEDMDALRDRLARFYAERTLLRTPVSAEDQAEAVYLLLSDRTAKTTGQVLTVDGGLPEAFAR